MYGWFNIHETRENANARRERIISVIALARGW